jgi:hypothetical protein
MAAGNIWGYADNARVGYYWYCLTSTNVCAQRLGEDVTAQSINVRIWVTPPYIRHVYLPMILR